MSLLLEFRPSGPLPNGINTPPCVVFGINGDDITSSLPPLIPLKLVLHFAPALQKWVLHAPDPTYLPRLDAEQALRIPHVGIDIQAPIEAEGLCWIVTRMLHMSGRKVPNDTFRLYPDLGTSLAIHKAWSALELPNEGLLSLHMHINAQLMLSSPPVSLWDMRELWSTFPHDSGIVRAMGLDFIEGLNGLEYKLHESVEILMWFESTPELFAFFKTLPPVVPGNTAEEKESTLGSGDRTAGKKTGKATKASVTKEAFSRVKLMERDGTRKVSPQERQERQVTDFQAMQSRLRRTSSNDSVRSIDTAIWEPRETEDKKMDEEEEGEGGNGVSVNGDIHDPGNYSGGSFSAELAKSLELIRLRRESRHLKIASLSGSQADELRTGTLQQHDGPGKPVSTVREPRHRRSCSTTTTGKKRSLLIADLKGRIKALEEKQDRLTRSTKDEDMDGEEGESDTARLTNSGDGIAASSTNPCAGS
ncbi:hypothetical protein SVAN01_06947 [Stagonosporopsis vannaccii]|nr:hypothetical protein SVAN01_06947 [Stagonosporopsis vannaccii]